MTRIKKTARRERGSRLLGDLSKLGKLWDEGEIFAVDSHDLGSRESLTSPKRFESCFFRVVSLEDKVLRMFWVLTYLGHKVGGKLSHFCLVPCPTFSVENGHFQFVAVLFDLHSHQVRGFFLGFLVLVASTGCFFLI